MKAAKPKDINMQLAGFRITTTLTDYAQKRPGHWVLAIKVQGRQTAHILKH